MHGLAHGAEMPLRVIHAMHALPEVTEWGGKKKLKGILKKMMNGDLGTSCSNWSVRGKACANGGHYVVRVLDWGLHKISKLHEYPLLTVARPFGGIPYLNIGWVGFLGAISGMNAEGITLGEMGYGDPANETLRGAPMPFVLRDVLWEASSIRGVHNILNRNPGTSSFVFLMADGKTGESQMYIRDRDRLVVINPGEEVRDKDIVLPAIKDTLYGGHYRDKMTEELTKAQGNITPELLMKDIIPKLAMPSNFQNVIYDPTNLQVWVANAKSHDERAAEQPYTFFDFKEALKS